LTFFVGSWLQGFEFVERDGPLVTASPRVLIDLEVAKFNIFVDGAHHGAVEAEQLVACPTHPRQLAFHHTEKVVRKPHKGVWLADTGEAPGFIVEPRARFDARVQALEALNDVGFKAKARLLGRRADLVFERRNEVRIPRQDLPGQPH
jgi:hypothetical protein